jgi:hypothetical protein
MGYLPEQVDPITGEPHVHALWPTIYKYIQTLDSSQAYAYGRKHGYGRGIDYGMQHGYQKGWWHGLCVALIFATILMLAVRLVPHWW